MRKRVVLCVMLTTVLFLYISGSVFAQDFYCFDSFDKYRQIRYWAVAHVSVNDYNYGSGDAKYLELTYKSNDSQSIEESTAQPIITHFRKEFDRLIKGKLPFHDNDVGRDKRFFDFFKKHGGKEDFIEKWQAHEEARRRSLYGTNPGSVYCLIHISRREFPILYEMKCSIVANNDLSNRGGIEEKNLGYSSPEHIEGELKRAITEQLERLKEKMEVIRKCPKKSK
ncbi:MAG: hypothetical protein HPY67_01900 [Syntrophaceae bacterium]|nr:hypothetical protein [Syntrophaceae bacterium]